MANDKSGKGRLNLKITEQARHCHSIHMKVTHPKWEQWFLLSSDRHHDNRNCDWDHEKEHLDEALARKAGILDAGDLFCAMQGKWDKRADVRECRPEHQMGDYLDSLVETAAEFYKPYAPNWILMAPGNHEWSIKQRHETNLTERLVERLKVAGAPYLRAASYSGYIRFIAGREASTNQVVLHWHHGYGGGGPVTRDTIQTARKAVYILDADIVWSGHTHDSLNVPIAKQRLHKNGDVTTVIQRHIKTAGYKNDFKNMDSWAVRSGHAPKPQGAQWLRFYWQRKYNKPEMLCYEVREAT